MPEMTDRIQELLLPILESRGLSLWELEFKKEGPKWLLRVYIDRDSGVSLDDCEMVSRDLGALLDVEDVVPHAYTLEVSSPGMDRTLSKPEHFKRFAGHKIKIKTFQPLDGEKVFHGELTGIGDQGITLKVDESKILEIPLTQIAKASLEVEF